MEPLQEIIAERRTYTAIHSTHSHTYGQLILPIHGELTINTKVHHLQLDRQTLFFIPPYCNHTFHSAGPNEFIVLDIPPFMIPSSRLPQGGMSYPLNIQWSGIRYLILNEIDQQSEHRSAVRELFPYIAYHLLQQQHPASIRYIHEHYDEDLSVQKLAALEHYNRSYYSDWFLRETGTSPSAYIQQVRLNKAKELLRDTDLPILHIAIQVGLAHQSSLTRLFHKVEGITPSQYRQIAQNRRKES